MQIELREEADKLQFRNEYPLSKKPMLIDILAIKKAGEEIHKNIGRIFRTYNLIEYKSPTDYLAVDDFYKAYAYACFFKADTGKQNEIPAEELTITFVSKHYPRMMIKHLEDVRKYTIEKAEPGIYYIHGDVVAIQIIVTRELLPEKNLWLYSLTDELKDSGTKQKLLNEYRGKENDALYSAVMQVITKANEKEFKEDEDMCDALMEIMEEVARKRVHDMIADERDELMSKGREEGKEEMGIASIKNLIETMKITADQAMDFLKITGDERERYSKMLQS